MTALSNFINILIQYAQKMQSNLKKKYRPFLKATLNLQTLAKSSNSKQSPHLTTQIIIFKLGLQSKQIKPIIITLTYLEKMFQNKFIDLHAPNYTQNFVIQQNGVRQIQIQKYTKQIRHQLVNLLSSLVPFQNNQINQLLLKNFQYLIGQQILYPIVQISYACPTDNAYNILCSYLNYRAYLYQEFTLYNEKQLQKRANLVVYRNQKLQLQLKKARDRNQKLSNLIEKYLQQSITKQIIKDGGKHGFCIICGEIANHFCKTTKVSLCGVDCKKTHLQMAQKLYTQNYQALILQGQLLRGLTYLFQCLYRKQSTLIMNVIIYISEHSSLFYILKQKFRSIYKKSISKIMSKLYQSKNQSIFSNIYTLMGNIITQYPIEAFSQIQYFIKTSIIKVLQDKKPKYNVLMIIFKTLSKIFENGKTVIQIYTNYDCQINQENILQKILFQLAKIAQDKYSNGNNFKTQQKLIIKNSSITLFIILIKSLNQYRKYYPKLQPHALLQERQNIDAILMRKQRKASLQRFVHKFNQNWSNGLKQLFNQDIVRLNSQQQITQIIMSSKNLKKQNIDLMMFSEVGKIYFEVFVKKIKQGQKGVFQNLVSYFRFLPLKKASIGCKMFIQKVLQKSQSQLVGKFIQQWVNFVQTMKNYQQFRKFTQKFEQIQKNTQIVIISQKTNQYLQRLYLFALQCQKEMTMGKHQHLYIHCASRQFTRVLDSQINLFQIPISFLLQTSYDIQRVLVLITELIQAYPNTNWLSMLIKNSFNNIADLKSANINVESIKIIKTSLDIIKNNSDCLSDWNTLLTFIKNLHTILIQGSPKKPVSENKNYLNNEISVVMLEKSIIGASELINGNFPQFMNNMLMVAKEDLLKFERPFMLQKYFEILEINILKYLNNFKIIFADFQTFVKQIPQSNGQTQIYICDMIKQCLLKILKKQESFQFMQKKRQQIQKGYFGLIQTILDKNNKQVKEFMMNCLSMVVIHIFNFTQQTWMLILSIIKKRTKQIQYRSQIHMIIQKIVSQSMKQPQKFFLQLVGICLLLVDQKQTKISIQSIHSVKTILQIMGKNRCNQNYQNLQYFRKLYQKTILKLIPFIKYQCHQNVIQIVFLFIQTKIDYINQEDGIKNTEFIFSFQDYSLIFDNIYNYIQQMEEKYTERGQKIMNQSLYWSVKHKNYAIISNLENSITKKYGKFSITAMKCIKTFIQMLHPKEKSDWSIVQDTLMRIIKDTQIKEALKKLKTSQSSFQSNKPQLESLTKKLMIQKMAVQLLPNDSLCIDLLKEIYSFAVQFNDNIQLRCQLWKLGLGQKGTIPPNILTLQEVISNRILAIYNSCQNFQQMYKFGLQILQRYKKASQQMTKLKSKQKQGKNFQISNIQYEMYEIQKRYWELRRVPLEKIILYLLPKLNKYCNSNNQCKKQQLIKRKQLFVQNVILILPYVQKRQSYLKSIEQATKIYRKDQIATN